MFHFQMSQDRPVVALGAHPDDIEIAAAGTLITLAGQYPESRFVMAIASASPDRRSEAEASAHDLLGDRVEIHVGEFEDGMLPYADPAEVKSWFRSILASHDPGLVIAPWSEDLHQDHRFVAHLAWQLSRRSTILEYHIPKWEGEPFVPNLLVPMSDETAQLKLDHLAGHFASQHTKPWYDAELFGGIMRIRGVEHGSARYAEGFVARKLGLEMGHL